MGPISSTIRGVIVSSILLPGALAALVAGVLADRYGRKHLILSGAVAYGVGAGIECGSVALGMFIAGRLVKGVGQGLFLSTVYVQVSEISPARARGTMTSIPQFLIVCGLVTGFFMCYGTASLAPSSAAWRLPLGVASGLAFVFAAMNVLMPPSPRWLLARGQTAQARAVVAALGLAEAEQREMLAGAAASGLEHPPDGASVWASLRRMLAGFGAAFARPARARTALGCFLMAFQQFCGIDGVLYYAPILFAQAGLAGGEANFLASGVSSLVILATTVPATLWADRWGRRTSSVVGGALITVLMLLMGTMYAADLVHADHGAGRWVVIVSIYLFAIVYNGTWALAFRTYLVESLPRKTRSSASSLGQCSNWVSLLLLFRCHVSSPSSPPPLQLANILGENTDRKLHRGAHDARVHRPHDVRRLLLLRGLGFPLHHRVRAVHVRDQGPQPRGHRAAVSGRLGEDHREVGHGEAQDEADRDDDGSQGCEQAGVADEW